VNRREGSELPPALAAPARHLDDDDLRLRLRVHDGDTQLPKRRNRGLGVVGAEELDGVGIGEIPGARQRPRLAASQALGDRLRLTSTAEFSGYDWSWTPRNFASILRLARDLFPEAADYGRGEYRACLRPMTPEGPPILGLARHRNLYLNCGHGHMGWTMACGTARIVADLMGGRMPELDLEGLGYR